MDLVCVKVMVNEISFKILIYFNSCSLKRLGLLRTLLLGLLSILRW